ncbi:hypothetical protein E4T56_gene18606 [Termitomyces sp. T112]|nr:hypothetical protein E4T56_gene18606 [Termitomyces sp. T112]
MGYIPQHALDNLKRYAYEGIDKSIISRYVLNPYWTWLVTLFPLNIAPNAITLTGLIIVIINFLTMIYYDPLYLTEKGGATGPPNWIYFTWAFGLFAYQSLDAIDGKQARRTGMAGPLGEMFDHGCDAMNTTLEVLLASQALNLGRSWWTVASQIATLANFYLTTWEEYHTGQLYLGVFSGPIEGILMIISIYLLSGIYGPSLWDRKILTITRLEHIPFISKLPNLPLNETFMVFGAFGLAFNIISSYANVRRAMKASGKPTIQPLLLLVPFVIAAGIQISWLAQPSYNRSAIINSPNFVPFLCAWGLQFAHQVGRMILAHVTSTPFPRWDWIWIWSIIGALDANLPRIIGRGPVIQETLKSATIFIWVTLALSLFFYTRFCTLVISDITNYLGIACFTVKKKDKDGVWRKDFKA